MKIEVRPCNGEPELLDSAFTGEFASEMATFSGETQMPPWCGYVAWDGPSPLGFGGFKGPPDPSGQVEIGYLTFPAAKQRGVATQVARGLLDIARRQGATSVLAHTLPVDNASTRVAEKAGFVRDGWGEDEDVGAVWRWRATLQAVSG